MRRFEGDTLLIATHNTGKLEEIADLLEPFGVSCIGAREKNLPEPEETESTFVGNARIKAHAASQATGLPALSDDSGITIDALDGAPGVYTADWAETPDGRDFVRAMTKTHEMLEERGASHPRLAQFRCTLVLAWPDGHDEVFEGVMPGHLVWPMRGTQGHGYDPIFQPDRLRHHIRRNGQVGEEQDLPSRRCVQKAHGWAALLENWQRAGFGIYVHWPFCEAKCPYCDFNSHVVRRVDHDAWADAFELEIERWAARLDHRSVSSVFFGGGTPSLMKPNTVERVLNAVRRYFPLRNDIEITLEANPSSVEANKFAAFADAGVNRVSLGVQALNDEDLKRLGRLHSKDEALRALDIAMHRFDRVSFDLIYARQNQSLRDWEAELDFALSLGARHMSLYQLTIEDRALHLETGLPSESSTVCPVKTWAQICTR